MPLIPATRERPPPIAGSNPPQEQTLLRGESAAGFAAFGAQQQLIRSGFGAVANSLEYSARIVDQIDESKRALKIQERVNEAQRRIADANEVAELDQIEATPETMILPEYQGSPKSPVRNLQRYGPQVGRLNVLLDAKRRQLATRDATSLMKQSATQAIQSGTMEALEAAVAGIGDHADLFGAVPTRELQVQYAQKIAQGQALAEATRDESSAEAMIAALQSPEAIADDERLSLLTPEARHQVLASALAMRTFKEREREIHDRGEKTAGLWQVARDGYLGPDNAPKLFDQFGPAMTLEDILAVIDSHAPLDANGVSMATKMFGLVPTSDDTLRQPTWVAMRAQAENAWNRRQKGAEALGDVRDWAYREPFSVRPDWTNSDTDKAVTVFYDQDAQALSDPITQENLGFQDAYDLYRSAPLLSVEKFFARRLDRVPLSSVMTERLLNDLKSSDPNTVQRSYTVLNQARLSDTASVSKKQILNDPRAVEAMAYMDNALSFHQEASPLDAANELVRLRAEGTDFKIDPPKAAAMIESEGGDAMLSEHLNQGPGEAVPEFFSVSRIGHGFQRIANAYERWDLGFGASNESIRAFGGVGVYGPIYVPSRDEEVTLTDEVGSIARDIVGSDDWIEHIRDFRAQRIENATKSPFDPENRPPFTPEMIDQYRWVLQDVLVNRNHGGDIKVAMRIADEEFFKQYRFTYQNRNGIPTLVRDAPEDQWAQTGGAPGLTGSLQLQMVLHDFVLQRRGLNVEPSMLWLNTEGGVRVDPETGLNSYIVMWDRPTGVATSRPEALRLPNGQYLRYTPHWGDAFEIRKDLDASREFKLREVLGEIGAMSPAVPVSGPYVGEKYEALRDLFPELEENDVVNLGVLWAMQQAEMFMGPGLNPENLYMNPPELKLSEHPDPAVAFAQNWVRGQIRTGILAEVELGKGVGQRINQALSPEASRNQVVELLNALGVMASPEEIMRAGGAIEAPIPGQRRPEPGQVNLDALQ